MVSSPLVTPAQLFLQCPLRMVCAPVPTREELEGWVLDVPWPGLAPHCFPHRASPGPASISTPSSEFVSTTITVWDLPPLSSFLKCLLCSDVDKRRAPGDPASFPGQSQTGLALGHTSLANQVLLVPDNLRNLRVMMRNQIGSPKKSLSTSYLCLVLLDPLDSYSHPRTNDAHSVAE